MATSTLPFFGTKQQRPGVLYPHAQWYFLAAMVMTWIGFGRSYFAVIRTEPLLHHVHGALMGGWIGLLVVQPMLYQSGRIRLHRSLGRWAVYLMVPGIVICGFLMLRSMMISTNIPPFAVNHLAFLDLSSLVLFPAFVALAVYYGRDVHLHARYIACTVILLMPPAVVRAMPMLPVFRHSFLANVNMALGLMDVILLLLILDDKRKGAVRAAYPVALVANTIVGTLANFAGGWGWWHGLMSWIAHL